MNKMGSTSEWTKANHKATEIINVKTIWISWYDDDLQGLKIWYVSPAGLFLKLLWCRNITDAQKQTKGDLKPLRLNILTQNQLQALGKTKSKLQSAENILQDIKYVPSSSIYYYNSY